VVCTSSDQASVNGCNSNAFGEYDVLQEDSVEPLLLLLLILQLLNIIIIYHNIAQITVTLLQQRLCTKGNVNYVTHLQLYT